MQTFNIHHAKTHLSKLLEQVANGEPFIIAKAGVPMAKVVALTAPEKNQIMRLGFMARQIVVPDDFDTMGQENIEQLFGAAE